MSVVEMYRRRWPQSRMCEMIFAAESLRTCGLWSGEHHTTAPLVATLAQRRWMPQGTKLSTTVGVPGSLATFPVIRTSSPITTGAC